MIARVDDRYSDRVKRWGLGLQKFDFTVQYIEGKANVLADALSRERFIEAAVGR